MVLFLSAADASLLIKWLEEGFPPSAIMTAIDRVAQKGSNKEEDNASRSNHVRRIKEIAKIQEKLTTPEPKHGFHASLRTSKT